MVQHVKARTLPACPHPHNIPLHSHQRLNLIVLAFSRASVFVDMLISE